MLCNLTTTDETLSALGQSGSFYGKGDGFILPPDEEKLIGIEPETKESISRCNLNLLSLLTATAKVNTT